MTRASVRLVRSADAETDADTQRRARRDALFVYDTEIAQRLGVGEDTLRPAIRVLEKKGFPKREALFGGRRWWPAVEAFFNRRYGVGNIAVEAIDGEEHFDDD